MIMYYVRRPLPHIDLRLATSNAFRALKLTAAMTSIPIVCGNDGLLAKEYAGI